MARRKRPDSRKFRSSRKPTLQRLEERHLLAADPFGTNSLQPLDVSRDGNVSPLDALRVINAIARSTGNGVADPAMSIGSFIDVNADGLGTTIDALQVINAIAIGNPLLAAKLSFDSGLDGAPRYDLLTNDYSFELNVSVGSRAASDVYLRLEDAAGGDYVNISNQFVGNHAILTSAELDELNGEPIPDGVLQIQVRLGEMAEPLDFALTVDREAPRLDSIGLERESDSGNLNDDQTIQQDVNLFGQTDPNTHVSLIGTDGVESDDAGLVRFQGLSLNLGPNDLIFSASDSAGNQRAFTRTIIREPINQPPVIDTILPISIKSGDYFEIPIVASDPEGEPVNLSLSGAGDLPPGRLETNGTLMFNPGPDDLGDYQFTIAASDGVTTSSQLVSLSVYPDLVTTTRLSGIVLNVESEPIVGIPVSAGPTQTVTDSEGRFTLDFGNVSFPEDKLVIHGKAFAGADTYPSVAERVDLIIENGPFDGVNNMVARPIYLPALNVDGGETVDPALDMTIRQQLGEGGEAVVTVEQGSLLDQSGEAFTGVLSVTEVPVNLTPAALPPEVVPDTVVTIQPGEMNFGRPSRLSLPNRSGAAPFTEMELWSINHLTGEFDVVGIGRVSSDGSTIETIEGGVRSSSWHFFAPTPQNRPNDPSNNPNTPQLQCRNKCGVVSSSVQATSEVALHSGEYIESHELVSYQSQGQSRGVSLTYRSLRADPRPIIHFGYDNLNRNRIYATLELNVGGVNVPIGGDTGFEMESRQAHFWNVGGQDVRSALQMDLATVPTGRYEYTLQFGTGSFAFRSLAPGNSPLEGESLPDFSFNGRARDFQGELLSVNLIDSPFGAGWSMDGWYQLVENSDGSVLMFDGVEEVLYRRLSQTSEYVSSPGDYSTLEKMPDGTFRLTQTDQMTLAFNLRGSISSVVDRNGNETRYEYDQSGKLTSIIDPVGLTTDFTYAGDKVTSITDPANRVTEFYYDQRGNLLQITDPDSSVRTFEYDDRHLITAEVNQRGVRETTQYGFHGRVESVVRGDGKTMSFQPAQVQGLFPRDRTSSVIDAPTAAGQSLAITRYTDASGDTFEVNLDAAGQVIDSTDAIGSGARVSRNSDNEVSTLIDARGNIKQFEYDGRGNLLSVFDSVSQDRPVIAGSIDSPGEVDSYRFELESERIVNLDVLVELTGAHWNLAGPSGVVFSETLFANSEYVFDLPAGDYTLSIDGELDTVGNYAFRLQDLSIAVPIGMNELITVNQSSYGFGEERLYQFEALAGDSFVVDLVSGSIDLKVFDPFGREVTREPLTGVAGHWRASTLSVGGTYTAFVSGAIPSSFLIHHLAPSLPTVISLQQPVTSNVDIPGATEIFTFSLDQYEQLYFDSLSDNGRLRYSIDGPQGRIAHEVRFSRESQLSPVSLAAPGDYTVTIFGEGDSTGTADFAVKTLSSATPIVLDDNVNSDLLPGNETDLYQLNLIAGDHLRFAALAADSSQLRWRLIAPTGEEVFSEPFADVDATLPARGVYTLMIEGDQQEPGNPNYTFRVEHLGNNVPTPLADTSINLESEVTGNIAASDQVDEYLLEIGEPTTLYLDALSDSYDIRVTVANTYGEKWSSRLTDLTDDGLLLPAGEFLVSVQGVSGATGEYGFKFRNLGSAPSLTLGQVVTSTFSNGRQAELYTFEATAGDRIYIDMISATGVSRDSYIDLIGPAGTAGHLNYPGRISDLRDLDDQRNVTLSQTGTYTLVVEAATDQSLGQVEFAVYPYQEQAALPLTIGQPVSGALSMPGESDRFDFSITEPARLYFDALTDTFSPQWELFGSSGRVDSGSIYPDENSVIRLDPGDYKLSVFEFWDELGDYSFRLLDLEQATNIQLDTEVSVQRTNAFATDAFSLTLPENKMLFFDMRLTQENINANAVPYVWTLVDPYGNNVFSQSTRYSSGSSLPTGDVGLSVPYDGTYTLLIHYGSDAPGNPVEYSFEVLSVQSPTPVEFTPGSVVGGTIGSPGSSDFYEFSLIEDSLLFIDIPDGNSEAFSNLYLSVTGPSGVVIESRGFHENLSPDSYFAPAGAYSVEVTGRRDGVADYSFRILDRSLAAEVQIDTPFSGQLNPSDSANLYRFNADAGDQLLLEIQSADLNSGDWKLIDPLGNNANPSGNGSDAVAITAAHTGTYVLAVRDTDGSGATVSEYDFEISRQGNTPPTYSGGTGIIPGNMVAGTWAANEERVFSFTLAESDAFQFDSIGDFDLSYKLFGLAGEYIEQGLGRYQIRPFDSGWQREHKEFFALAGTHTLVVKNESGLVGDSAFRLNAFSDAQPIEFGDLIEDTLDPADASHAYRFNASAGAQVLVDIQPFASATPQMQLYDAYGLELGSLKYGDFEATIPRTGEYFLIVSDNSPNFGDSEYRIRIVENILSPTVALELPTSGVEVFSYDSTFSQLTSYVDERGNQTLFDIDPANGNLLSIRQVVGLIDVSGQDGDDVVTSIIYTASGLPSMITDPLGRVTTNDYDAFDRLVSTTYAVGTTDEAAVSYEYDIAGNLTAMIDENGSSTQYEYDLLNRLVRVIDADPDGGGPLLSPITQLAYDAAGNQVSITDARGNVTTNTFDEMDRLIRSVAPNETETVRTYDGDGNLLTFTDSLGHTTTNVYDERNRLVSTTDAESGETRFEYDADGNLSAVIDPVLNRTEFRYDSRNRMIGETDPLGQEKHYEYDQVGNLIQTTDRNGRQMRFHYDSLNRVASEFWINQDESLENEIVYSYDEASNLLSVTDDFSALTYTYDNRDRILTVDNLGTPSVPNVVLTYQYDAVGNVLSVGDTIDASAGALTTYQYDRLNRTTRVSQAGNAIAEKRVDLAYNPLGQYSSIQRYSDLAAQQSVVDTSYEYDDLNRVVDLRHHTGATDLAFYEFSYDDANRITSINDIDGLTNYVYDDRDQLTGADRSDSDLRGDESYEYDANGNRVSSHLHAEGYVTGPGNRLLSDGTYDYTYDDEGNMLTRTEITTGEERRFEWDHRNRLASITDRTSGGTLIQRLEFTYDAENRRLTKSVESSGGEEVVTHFVYDREDVILDFIEDNTGTTVDQRYLHGPEIDQVFAQEDGNGDVLWLTADHLGTTRDLVNSSGQITQHIQYDSFGNALTPDIDSLLTRYLFTSREFDAEIELQFSRARYYGAAHGRFISVDPIGFRANDANLYRYVSNRAPLSKDSSGKSDEGVFEDVKKDTEKTERDSLLMRGLRRLRRNLGRLTDSCGRLIDDFKKGVEDAWGSD